MRYRVWRRLSFPLLLVTVGALALVLHPGSGVEAYGASRWVSLGPFTIQPSELAKLALVVFAATTLSRSFPHLSNPRRVLVPLAPVVVLVCGMVMLQPDLGTTVILAGSTFLLLFAAGVPLRYLTLSGLAAAAVGATLIMSAHYRRVRFLSFLHPWADVKGAGWQLAQSLIALGSGGWTGVGLGASRQKWMYVPNAHTDFIFSILGEELGLIGEIVVLATFTVLLYSGIRVAVRAGDVFGRLLAAGIVSWFALQVVVNLGAVTGLLPITGVPLPFLSYGGSSLVVSLAAVGILVNIARSSSASRPNAIRSSGEDSP
jgi:cell division protein FtsW